MSERQKIEYKTTNGKKDGPIKGGNKTQVKETQATEKNKRDTAARLRAENKERIKKTGTLTNQKLFAPSRNNFHRRWVNDEGARVASMENNGYTHVELSNADIRLTSASNIGGKIGRLVGTQQDGSPLFAYLMEIPIEFHNQDRQGNLDKIAEKEKGLRNGNMNDPDSQIWSGEVNFK